MIYGRVPLHTFYGSNRTIFGPASQPLTSDRLVTRIWDVRFSSHVQDPVERRATATAVARAKR
jgi:hypothetical protein